MDNTVKVRQYAAEICILFETVLDKHNITIPDECRTGAEDEARLFGYEYSDLEYAIVSVLRSLIDEVKANPDAPCEYFNYS